MNGPSPFFDGIANLAPVTDVATAKKAGLMAAVDKAKLDALYQAYPACRVNHLAAQATTSAVTLALAFNNERFDGAGYHDPAANSSRLTVPDGLAGLYQIGGTVEWAAHASGLRLTAIRLNGTTDIARVRWTPAGTDNDTQTIVTLYRLAVGDYVELTAFQNCGAALNVQASANFSPEFWLVRLGD